MWIRFCRRFPRPRLGGFVVLSLVAVIVCAVAGGCGSSDRTDLLPATFRGTLPCADCPGLDMHIDFYPDGVFHRRLAYRDKAGGPFDDTGTWTMSSDNRRLLLVTDGGDTVRFAADRPGVLRLLDSRGDTIQSDLNYTLERARTFQPIQSPNP